MKGFLIFMAVVVGGGVFAIVRFEDLATGYLATLAKTEGGPGGSPAFETLKVEKPDDFKKKYQPILEKRLKIAVMSNYLGNGEFFEKVATETKMLYLNAPTDKNPRFGKMMVMLGERLEERQQFGPAFEQYKEFKANFPDHPDVKMAEVAIQRLRIKYGLVD